MHIMEPIRSWGEPLIDEWAEKLGAKCKTPTPSCQALLLSILFSGSEGKHGFADPPDEQMFAQTECGTTTTSSTGES